MELFLLVGVLKNDDLIEERLTVPVLYMYVLVFFTSVALAYFRVLYFFGRPTLVQGCREERKKRYEKTTWKNNTSSLESHGILYL